VHIESSKEILILVDKPPSFLEPTGNLGINRERLFG
tara:strand:- start:370 stop:477 length:108 start_codon:yes stop_codon:yes gene_type:complete